MTMPSTEPYIARACSWAALIGAFLLSWTTWVGVGGIAEYGAFRYALPVCVDGYIVTVLMAWIAPRDSKAARFARWNVYLSAGLSILTQSVYHGALVYAHTDTPWKSLIAWLAGALPPLFAALSVHFRTGVRVTESQISATPQTLPVAVQSPLAPPTPAATAVPRPTPQAAPSYPVVSRETPPPATSASPARAPVPATSPRTPPTSAPARRSAVPARPLTLPQQPRQAPARQPRGQEATARRDRAWAIFDNEARTGHRVPRSQIARQVGVTERQVKYYLASWRQAQGERQERSA